jgi:hypothetical protein
MIEFTTSKGSFIAVSVPDNLQSYGLGVAILNKKGHGNYLTYCTTEMPWHEVRISLPFGEINDFEMIGLTSSILKSDEQAARVVGKREFFRESPLFQAILDEHGIVTEALIIKKQIV